jgi:hypothetical protein
MALTPSFSNGGVRTTISGASVPAVAQVDGLGNVATPGGTATVAVAAGVATDTVVKAASGRLCRILVTAVGTNPLSVWDNASGHTGTVIGQLAASAPIGSYDFQLPAANGITVQGNAANPAITVSYY